MAISSHGVDVCLWIDSRATLCNSVCGFGSVAVLGIVGKSVTLLASSPTVPTIRASRFHLASARSVFTLAETFMTIEVKTSESLT